MPFNRWHQLLGALLSEGGSHWPHRRRVGAASAVLVPRWSPGRSAVQCSINPRNRCLVETSTALSWDSVQTPKQTSVSMHFRCESPAPLNGEWNSSWAPFSIFPQQRKLMGSSAQNSSGGHWCRHRVRFNEVPEKVPKVPEKVWEASVQSQVTFTGFRRRKKVPGGFGAEPGHVQQGEGSGEGVGGFGVEPG